MKEAVLTVKKNDIKKKENRKLLKNLILKLSILCIFLRISRILQSLTVLFVSK